MLGDETIEGHSTTLSLVDTKIFGAPHGQPALAACAGSNVLMTRCSIVDCSTAEGAVCGYGGTGGVAYGDGGLVVDGSARVTLKDVTITGNSPQGITLRVQANLVLAGPITLKDNGQKNKGKLPDLFTSGPVARGFYDGEANPAYLGSCLRREDWDSLISDDGSDFGKQMHTMLPSKIGCGGR